MNKEKKSIKKTEKSENTKPKVGLEKNKSSKDITKSVQKVVTKPVQKYSVYQASIKFCLSFLNRAVLFNKYDSRYFTEKEWEAILKKENLNFKKR